MGRTILEIAQEAAERDATAPPPVKLFGGGDQVSRILIHAAKDTMREYLRQSNWAGLSEFHSAWVFSLQRGKCAYPLPPDFLRMIPGTEQRSRWPMGLLGPATPQAWASWVHGGSAVAAPAGWRIKNNALWIEPTPNKNELVVIEYITRYPVVSRVRDGDFDFSLSVPQTYVPIVPRDGHLSVGDRNLILGEDLTTRPDESAQYDVGLGYDVAIWPDEPAVLADVSTWPTEPMDALRRINPASEAAPLPEVRRPEFTADTDSPAFDDDHILSLGMTFRLRRALGLPFLEHAAEYEEEMEIKLATDAGGARAFRLGGDRPLGGQVPLGGGLWLID